MTAAIGVTPITASVSKRTDAPYRSGPSKVWLKAKNPASEAVRREREEEWRYRPADGHQMHELGSIDVMRLDQSLGRSRHVACASSCIPVKQSENSRGKLPKQNSIFYASGKSKHQYLYRSLTRTSRSEAYAELNSKLAKLERYERRALSRRKRALRAINSCGRPIATKQTPSDNHD